MPKTLVVSDSSELAAAVADGARSVRFSEVEVRSPGELGADELAPFDAIIVGVAGAGIDGVLAALASLRERGALANRVGSAFGDSALAWQAMQRLGALGMILVPPADDPSAGREQGRRVVEVTGWITHARSHHHH